jgi:hypothetical protein
MVSLAMRGVAEPRRARAQRADRVDEFPVLLDSSGSVVDLEAYGCEVGAFGEAGKHSAPALRRPAWSERLLTGPA